MLQTNSPLILVGPDRASEHLPPVPAKMLNKFKTVQAMVTSFETFPKNYLGTFKFVVTCTSKFNFGTKLIVKAKI